MPTQDPDGESPDIAGRKSRFERLILPHLSSLYRGAYRLTGNQADAEDLLQDALLKAYSNMDSLREETNPAGWAYTILKNSFLNMAGRRRLAPAPMDGALVQNRLPSPDPPPGDSPEDGLDGRLNQALASMPDEMRLILVAREVEGLSYQQIARMMGLSLGTVKSRINRAREKLRALYIRRK